MDKTAIKNFSIWARNKLIADITYKAGLLGVTEEGIKDALPQSTKDAEFYDIGTKEPYFIHGEEIKQRKELASAIKRKAAQLDYKEAYRSVIEEVAYTWFNRLIAIRFMEVNDYIPSHIRVLSSEGGKKLEPDLVTTPFDAEIDFTTEENEAIMQMKNDNQVDTLFRFLFIKQCNVLNAYLPKLFEKTSDYTELLLNISATDQDGIVYHLTHDIKEDDFNISNVGEDGKPTGQVEIIGWMYQYYNTEPKDEAFALLKSNVKISKERIPAATQLFTPDWIVRYMVENSVGRLWLEGHENEALKSEWKYYLDEAEQESDVIEQLKVIRDGYKDIKPEEIKVIDPCMGSGHILVYAFDVLMQIYESYGYSQRDATKSIVENNIYGLDIDDRAFQLAYFAIMMKARSYNRRFLSFSVEPNVSAIQDSNTIDGEMEIGDYILSKESNSTLSYLVNMFKDAKEYGSILNIDKRDYLSLLNEWNTLQDKVAHNIVHLLWYKENDQVVRALVKQALILSLKYEVVVTNPPYLSNGGMNERVSDYCKKNYFISKGDLCTVFIEKCMSLALENGYCGFITMQSWMFLTSFEKLRREILKKCMVNMLHLGSRAFAEISGEVVNTTTFIFSNRFVKNYLGTYYRLVDYKSQDEKERAFLDGKEIYYAKNEKFLKIPNAQVAYWIEDRLINLFDKENVGTYAISDGQTKTGNNDKYLRNIWEIDCSKIGKGKKWVPHAKGGTFRRWYGNVDTVIDWSDNAREHYRKDKVARIAPEYIWFREGVCWNLIKSGEKFATRYLEESSTFNIAGPAIFFDDTEMNYYVIGLLNSVIAEKIINFLNPTLSTNIGDIYAVPLLYNSDKNKQKIVELVKENILIAKEDWDCYECSMNFKKHPLVRLSEGNLRKTLERWQEEIDNRISLLQENEKQIDILLLQSYNLEGVLSIRSDDYLTTLHTYNESQEIKSLISYAIGCIFGRFSLYKEGAIETCIEDRMDVFQNYLPDDDNIIPITDEEYFSDDIVGKILEWIKIVFGSEYYEENIKTIALSLGNTGNTSKDVIRGYIIKELFADHVKTYQKKPIYWLFDSGKQNGFKALIYMHRYNADTIGNLRVDYLHRMERIYESEINRMQDTIDNSSNAREVTAASKRKEKLQKQLKECQEYDEKIGHLALSRTEIDLDDGVKVNYDKIQTANDGKKYQVLAKI